MIFQTEEKKLNGYGLEVKGRVNKDKWNLGKRKKTKDNGMEEKKEHEKEDRHDN